VAWMKSKTFAIPTHGTARVGESVLKIKNSPMPADAVQKDCSGKNCDAVAGDLQRLQLEA
jgi:hypothetical protein